MTNQPYDPNNPYGGSGQSGSGGYPNYPGGGAYPGGYQPAGTPPPNHLAFAIISTVLCCLPLGIASIIFSTQVNTKWNQGDVDGAQIASRRAKTFAIWSVVSVLIIYGIIAILLVAGVLTLDDFS